MSNTNKTYPEDGGGSGTNASRESHEKDLVCEDLACELRQEKRKKKKKKKKPSELRQEKKKSSQLETKISELENEILELKIKLLAAQKKHQLKNTSKKQQVLDPSLPFPTLPGGLLRNMLLKRAIDGTMEEYGHSLLAQGARQQLEEKRLRQDQERIRKTPSALKSLPVEVLVGNVSPFLNVCDLAWLNRTCLPRLCHEVVPAAFATLERVKELWWLNIPETWIATERFAPASMVRTDCSLHLYERNHDHGDPEKDGYTGFQLQNVRDFEEAMMHQGGGKDKKNQNGACNVDFFKGSHAYFESGAQYRVLRVVVPFLETYFQAEQVRYGCLFEEQGRVRTCLIQVTSGRRSLYLICQHDLNSPSNWDYFDCANAYPRRV